MLGATTQQVILTGSNVALSTAGAIAAPSIAAAIGLSTAVAVPIIGAVVAGITFAIMEFTQGCNSCIVTSGYANKIEPLMQQNLAAWQASDKTCAEQKQCVANFDSLWATLAQACSNPQFGGAGENCIKDRQAGSCKWKDTNGNCWNWFSGYRDPIANDSCSDNNVVNNLSDAVFGDSTPVVSGIDNSTLLIVGMLVVGGMLVAS